MVNKKMLVQSIGVPLVGGGIIGYVTSKNDTYTIINKPPLSPPPIVFPIVWAALYIMMGLAYYFVYTSGSNEEQINKSRSVFSAQLILNFLWPIIFFTLNAFWAAVICLLFLIIMIFKTYKEFLISDKRAANLLIPYIIWCLFALYLNIGIAILN